MARLKRVDCSGPGIRRRRRGKGFEYRDADGHRITEPSVLERIRELAIPPAWERRVDLSLSDGPHPGHRHRCGGPKQYRYHDLWRQRRDREKFDEMLDFARSLPRLRKRVARIWRSTGMPRDKSPLACATRLLDLGFFRIGSEDYAEENDTYGLATMKKRHVTVDGDEVTFDYEAKGGKRRIQAIGDARWPRSSRDSSAVAAGRRAAGLPRRPAMDGRQIGGHQRVRQGGHRRRSRQGLPHLEWRPCWPPWRSRSLAGGRPQDGSQAGTSPGGGRGRALSRQHPRGDPFLLHRPAGVRPLRRRSDHRRGDPRTPRRGGRGSGRAVQRSVEEGVIDLIAEDEDSSAVQRVA